jgi:hypothetical protein
VKRALASLQRKGQIIGFPDAYHTRAPGDGRIELCHIWMTEKGLARWLAAVPPDDAMVIAKHAKAMGMSVPEDAREGA